MAQEKAILYMFFFFFYKFVLPIIKAGEKRYSCMWPRLGTHLRLIGSLTCDA